MRPLTGKDRIWLAWWILTKKDVNWTMELKVDPKLQRPLDEEKLKYWKDYYDQHPKEADAEA